MRYWWVSASENSEGGWHWGYFFQNPRTGKRWGGPEWIRSTLTYKHIRRIRQGDLLVVAYQAKEGIVGLALFASDGYQSTTGANYDMFDLASQPVLSLKQRVPLDTVRMLPHSKTTIQFLRVLRGTVFEVKPVGFERIVALLLAFNPGQARQIATFLSKTKVKLPYRIA